MGFEAVMAAAALVSAYSSYQQGQANAEAANYNRKVADENAQMTEAQGQAAVEAQRRNQQRQIGAAVAAYGASGVDPSGGSPMDVLQASVREATLDQATTKYNYDVRATAYRNQSSLAGMQADNASTAGTLNALGSLANGAAGYIKYGGTKTPGMGSV